MRKSIRGFTLLELIVVIAIIGIISVIIIPSFRNALVRANDTKLKQFAITLDKKFDITNRYDFEEGSGLVAKDSNIYTQNNMTIPGSGVTYSKNTYSSSSQYSLNFDGTNKIISQSNISPDLDNKSFSISLWFRVTSFDIPNNFFLSKGSGFAGQQLSFGIRNNRLMVGFYSYDWMSPIIVLDTNWHHVAFSFDSSTRKGILYFDGVKVKDEFTYGVALNNTNSSPLYIGSLDAYYFFTGQLDDIRFYEGQVIVR